MEERIDPVAMNNDPCVSAGSKPRKGRCMKCARTLTAARAMSSDVVTHNKKDGRWRCRPCDDEENRKEGRRKEAATERWSCRPCDEEKNSKACKKEGERKEENKKRNERTAKQGGKKKGDGRRVDQNERPRQRKQRVKPRRKKQRPGRNR